MDSADWASFGDYWLTTALEDRAESAPWTAPAEPADVDAEATDDR